jgi:hypothetical protein
MKFSLGFPDLASTVDYFPDVDTVDPAGFILHALISYAVFLTH